MPLLLQSACSRSVTLGKEFVSGHNVVCPHCNQYTVYLLPPDRVIIMSELGIKSVIGLKYLGGGRHHDK